MENVIPILFDPLLNDRFITPCFYFDESRPSLFDPIVFSLPDLFAGGRALPSAKMINWTVQWLVSRPDWPIAIQTALGFS